MREFAELWARAVAAGREAGAGTKPVAMAVQAATGLTDGFDWNRPYEVVADGVCGFAWLEIRKASPAGRNDSPLVKWLRKQGIGRYDDYRKCWTVWISDYNQSMQRKEAHAEAMAKVLREAGVQAYAASRMD